MGTYSHVILKCVIISVFNNMRTLKFKPQLTVYVFRCRQSSKRTSRETKAHFSQVKRSRLSVVIGRFRSILFVSGFQGSLAVAIIMIDGSEKPNRQLGFELQSSHVIENRNKRRISNSREYTSFFSGLWRRCFFRRTSALYLVFSPYHFLSTIDNALAE